METKERIINMLADKLGFEPMEINENQDFVTDLGADSLDMVEIVMGVEEEFGLRIEDEEIPEVKTVGDLVKLIEKKRLGR